jgi:hypothetical protein
LNDLTTTFVIETLEGVKIVPQFAPLNPTGQSQPHSSLDIPLFKQVNGVQGGSLSLSDEQDCKKLKIKKANRNTFRDIRKI